MRKTNILMVLFLWIVPEIILWILLQDFLNRDFIDVIITIYFILIFLWLLRFIFSEISFRLFVKDEMIDYVYKTLVDNNYPNPWNYFIDDWIRYFEDVGRDINNELLDVDIINGATTIYSETMLLYNLHKFWQYWRTKWCLKIAVKRYMDKNFQTGYDNLVLDKSNLLKKFKELNFLNPNKLSFDNPLCYLDLVIESKESNFISKRYACKIRYIVWKIHSDINYNESEYWFDISSEKEFLELKLNEISDSINEYSKTF